MMRSLTLAAACACALPGLAVAAAPSGDRLASLFQRHWEWRLANEPELATEVGDPRYNDRWADASLDAIARHKKETRAFVAEAKKIDRKKLSPENQLNLDLFLYDLERDVEGQRFPGEVLAINQMWGVFNQVPYFVRMQPRTTEKQFGDVLARLRAVPVLVDQKIALLKKGMESGVVLPRAPLVELPRLIANQITDDPQRAPIYTAAFEKMPANIAASQQKELRDEAVVTLREAVFPAFKKLGAFIESEYLPKTRASIALGDLPDGKAWYAHLIARETTTDRSADAIHQLGLDEVKRIRGEMEAVMAKTAWKGDLKSFFHHLRTDPRFFFSDAGALISGYRDIAKRIDGELPRLFGTLPRLSYGVQPVPAYSEKTQTTAFYQAGSTEAGRAGIFFANTYDLPSRPKWEMESLTAHEAVPGHHLQVARAEELLELPAFRRYGGYSAFVEGWGLYAESLGDELGLYKDPYAKFGQLTYEMWRAIRLVVDTGIHQKGWTRDRAIAFFAENSGKAMHDIQVEIDRYIVWPGQALAYKLGELKLKELRRAAAAELGPRFDVRKFHDLVLGAGALPLDVLEARVRTWVTSQKGAKTTP